MAPERSLDFTLNRSLLPKNIRCAGRDRWQGSLVRQKITRKKQYSFYDQTIVPWVASRSISLIINPGLLWPSKWDTARLLFMAFVYTIDRASWEVRTALKKEKVDQYQVRWFHRAHNAFIQVKVGAVNRFFHSISRNAQKGTLLADFQRCKKRYSVRRFPDLSWQRSILLVDYTEGTLLADF